MGLDVYASLFCVRPRANEPSREEERGEGRAVPGHNAPHGRPGDAETRCNGSKRRPALELAEEVYGLSTQHEPGHIDRIRWG